MKLTTKRRKEKNLSPRKRRPMRIMMRMKRTWVWLVVPVLAVSGCQKQRESASKFAATRQRMVEEQLRPRGIKDQKVLMAMAQVPREEFVATSLRGQAYLDQPLPIGHNQTISQPFIVAFMTEQLHLYPTDRVLEVGTGSGYQTAVLAELVKDVYSIEILEPLAKEASSRLARLGYSNAHVKTGDG